MSSEPPRIKTTALTRSEKYCLVAIHNPLTWTKTQGRKVLSTDAAATAVKAATRASITDGTKCARERWKMTGWMSSSGCVSVLWLWCSPVWVFHVCVFPEKDSRSKKAVVKPRELSLQPCLSPRRKNLAATPCSSDLASLLLDPSPATSSDSSSEKRAERTCALPYSRWCETCWEKHFVPDFCSGCWFWWSCPMACQCLSRAYKKAQPRRGPWSIRSPRTHDGSSSLPLADWLTSVASFSLETFGARRATALAREPHCVHLSTVPLDFSWASPCPIALRGLTVSLDSPRRSEFVGPSSSRSRACPVPLNRQTCVTSPTPLGQLIQIMHFSTASSPQLHWTGSGQTPIPLAASPIEPQHTSVLPRSRFVLCCAHAQYHPLRGSRTLGLEVAPWRSIEPYIRLRLRTTRRSTLPHGAIRFVLDLSSIGPHAPLDTWLTPTGHPKKCLSIPDGPTLNRSSNAGWAFGPSTSCAKRVAKSWRHFQWSHRPLPTEQLWLPVWRLALPHWNPRHLDEYAGIVVGEGVTRLERRTCAVPFVKLENWKLHTSLERRSTPQQGAAGGHNSSQAKALQEQTFPRQHGPYTATPMTQCDSVGAIGNGAGVAVGEHPDREPWLSSLQLFINDPSSHWWVLTTLVGSSRPWSFELPTGTNLCKYFSTLTTNQRFLVDSVTTSPRLNWIGNQHLPKIT